MPVHRIGWLDVPEYVRDAIRAEVGSDVVHVEAVDGGFSPCLVAKLELSNREPVFVKAVSSHQNPDSPHMVRREIEVMAVLPSGVPAPRLVAAIDDGEWVAGIFECIDGRLPVDPWSAQELTSAIDALARLNATPAPPELLSAAAFLAPLFNGWQKLVARDAVPARWATRSDALVALEHQSLDWLDGDRLVHNDVRADNMLITPSGEVVFVDWAHACRGPAWLDLVLWACALELEGGGPPAETMRRLAPESGPTGAALTAVVAAILGYFEFQGALPDPPGLPTVRAFQRAQGEIAARWLDELLEATPA